jgi:hypothetical protein
MVNPLRSVTALDMIKRAYRLIGVYSIGETPTADESVDGLSALNALVDSWANEGLMIYAPSLDSIALTANLAAYTLGTTGTVITDRPVDILDASYIEYQGVSFPVTVATLDQYTGVPFKGTQDGLPFLIWYQPDYPNGTLTVYPAPLSSCTLKLWSKKMITQFAALTTVLTLPLGYEDAMVYNLAARLAPENEMPVPNEVARSARNLKRTLKRTNTTVPIMDLPSAVLPGDYGPTYNGQLL